MRLKNILFTLSLIGVHLATQAQKKNEVIENSIAPQQVKIDGKLNEWGDSLKNYNAAAKLSYVIANDENKLYLAIRSSDKQIISKIMVGGIDFTVNTSGKKKEGPTVTFPVINRQGMRQQGGKPNKQQFDTTEMRQKMFSQIKEIKVNHFKSIVDGSISIYNDYGISAAVAYDASGGLVYELAIPLQQLELSATDNKVLAYNIKINGLQLPQMPSEGNRESGGYPMGGGMYGGGMYGGGGMGRYNGNAMDRNPMFQSTDFWIKATLVKK